MDINPLNGLYVDFTEIIKKCVIKYDNKANKYETLDITKKAERYISAYLKEDNFYSHMNYNRDFLIKLGITDTKTLELYEDNRRNIPNKYHDKLLEMQREKIVSEYIEENNYYRMLAGLPDIEDNDYIFIDDETADINNLDNSKPIHEMSLYDIVLLNEIGYIDKIISDYPDKKYLSYLGNNKIDIITSRRAKNFSVIRIPTSISELMNNTFKIIYEQCREYFTMTIYIHEYSKMYDYYDNFIALCIMVMCMQQIISRTLKNMISREFFDLYCIKLLYEAYNVPFIDALDSSTQRTIVENLNILIQYKSTDKVLYDIASLLGYDRVKIFKYYLMKNRLFDIDGQPIDKTKTIINDEGEYETVPDYESMYEVYFQKIELKEQDYHKALQSSTNKVQYKEVIEEDPFWWEDDELYKELYEDEYNFKETKYLSMNISYRLTEVMFETVYLIRMLIDKKDEIFNIRLQLPRILGSTEVSLFQTVITLCAMLCKKNNLKGEILTSHSKILHVLGFNFRQDFNTIRNHIHDNEYLDNDMIKYLENMTAYTIESVNNLYNNIKELRDFISEKMAVSDNIHEYRAYVKLYQALYLCEESREMFITEYEDDKPIYANTYMEYLKKTNTELYEFVDTTSVVELTQYVDHIISKMTEIIPTIKYLYVANDANNLIAEALLKLIRFFKSYTTDMIGMNIVYIFDTKALNMLKLIDDIHYIKKTIVTPDSFALTHSDVINKIILNIHQKDFLKLYENISLFGLIRLFERFYLKDAIYHIDAKLITPDKIKIFDTLDIYKIINLSKDILKFKDCGNIINMLYHNDLITFKESIILYAIIKFEEKISISDFISNMNINVYNDEKHFILNDYSRIEIFIKVISNIFKDDKIQGVKSDILMKDIEHVFDSIDNIIKNLFNNDKNILLDEFFLHYVLYINNTLIYKDGIKLLSTNTNINDNISIYDTIEMVNSINLKDEINFMKDIINTYNTFKLNDNKYFIETIKNINKTNNISDNINFISLIYDMVKTIEKHNHCYITDKLNQIIYNALLKTDISFNEIIYSISNSLYDDTISIYDTSNINTNILIKDSSLFKKETININYVE